jgi:hypothetical protein
MQFREGIDAAGLQGHSAHLVFNKNDPDLLFEDAHALGAYYVVSSAMLPQRALSASGPTTEDYKQMAQRLNNLGRRLSKPVFNTPTTTIMSSSQSSKTEESVTTSCLTQPTPTS